MRRYWALVRVLGATSAAAAFRRAAPLYFAIGVVAAIVFGGNGLDPRTVVRLTGESAPFRLGLWAGWLVLTTPVVHALCDDRESRLVRSLPVPRAALWLVLAAHLAVAEAPWTLLWGLGGGWLAGAAATLLALAAHALVVARPRRGRDWFAAALVVLFMASPAAGGEASWQAGLPAWAAASLGRVPPWVAQLAALGVGLVAARVGVAAAFARAPERDARRRRRVVGGPRVVALALAHLASLRRGDGAVLLRAILLTLLGGGAAALAARSNRVSEPAEIGALSLAIGAAPVAFACAALGRPMLGAERRQRWLFAALGVRPATRALGAAFALAAAGFLLGLADGSLVSLGVGAAPMVALRLVAAGGLGGSLLGLVVAACARWSERGDPRDASRNLVSTGGAACATVLATLAFAEASLAAWALGAAGASAASLASAEWLAGRSSGRAT